ncbi:acyltransferase family protein [Microbacterium sp. B19]|uniref:acyltransferase family protein n=1 Tax=Microbacterium sp. B19 TaxID=96765 RepID=UPI0034D5442C
MSAVSAPPLRRTRTRTVDRSFRAEIQALRSVAVMGVLLFHLWTEVFPGGFVSVDVFFVLSGFLITDHLVREVRSRGRVSLPQFWARRARRLLPADSSSSSRGGGDMALGARHPVGAIRRRDHRVDVLPRELGARGTVRGIHGDSRSQVGQPRPAYQSR